MQWKEQLIAQHSWKQETQYLWIYCIKWNCFHMREKLQPAMQNTCGIHVIHISSLANMILWHSYQVSGWGSIAFSCWTLKTKWKGHSSWLAYMSFIYTFETCIIWSVECKWSKSHWCEMFQMSSMGAIL